MVLMNAYIPKMLDITRQNSILLLTILRHAKLVFQRPTPSLESRD